ncbi:MAG: spore cortex biosynthesis protein YabQ [Oscillospiraceae bacterium]|nr:spore cortex biosynthesis protein YabQ [Oscillospiraceae bacterium]
MMGLELLTKTLDTFRTVDEELGLFVFSILLGLPAGVLMDLLRLLRKLIPHHVIFLACEDIFYLICLSFLILCYTSAFGGGEFRVYYSIGCLLGLLLYYVTIGAFLMKCSDLILKPVHWIWDHFVCICIKLKLSFVKCAKKSGLQKKNSQNGLPKPSQKVYNKNSRKKYAQNQKKAGKSHAERNKT